MTARPLSVALETSCSVGGVALGEGGSLLASRSLGRGMRHGRDLVPTVGWLARQHGRDLSRLELVMVDVGPGSFTGLRVGLATAKAFHLATRCLVVGVLAPDAVVAGLPAVTGQVCVVIDATRGELYAACYRPAEDGAEVARGAFTGAAGAWQRSFGPTIVEPAELMSRLDPDCLVTGGGLGRYADDFREAGLPLAPEGHWLPRAEWVYALGWKRHGAGLHEDPYQLEPIYLRLSAAEERWRQKHGLG